MTAFKLAFVAALALLSSAILTHAFTHSSLQSFKAIPSSRLAYAASTSMMETDYASLYDTEHTATDNVPSSKTDEELLVASNVPTFDRAADAYSRLPQLWSGSPVGKPSMMEELLQQERALAERLELDGAQKEEEMRLEQSTTRMMTVAATTRTRLVSFECDGLMMVESMTPQRL
ncbi:hypothetical protein IV203_017362 [Nitzschia inconspicua]|uniref:Uncharacterized protein n=1 Tax=Nitzschia inconspicua TaxID=303405 RepID=A0A9K3PIA8_9STRA|nr:hypothetical protein IV203_017362 [Nitzschia inconspicua]